MSHEMFENRYIFKGEIKTKSPFHIGSGEKARPGEIDNVFIKYNNGTCYIPGSTLKGYIRSTCEKLASQLPRFKDRIKHKAEKPNSMFCDVVHIRNNKNISSAEILKELCPICKLFGAMGYASRVYIPDAAIKSNSAILNRRVHIKIDRDSETVASKAVFDVPIFPKGEGFSFEANLENVTDEDLLLFKYGIYFLLDGNAFLGGNKSRGYGRVELILESVNKYSIENIIKGTKYTEFLQSFQNLGRQPLNETV